MAKIIAQLGNRLLPSFVTMSVAAQTVSTAPYHGYQVLQSPFSSKIAFAGAQNYGIAGKRKPRPPHSYSLQ